MAFIEIIANGNVAFDNGNGNDDNDDANAVDDDDAGDL